MEAATRPLWRRLHPGYVLLAAVPAAFLLHALGAGPVAVFLTSGLGIIPLAALLGRSTEALSSRLGPQVGGFLNATFGNAAELILGLAALRRGLFPVVKASLTGSIIGNALLVLGLSLLAGGLRHRRQTFDRIQAGLQATLLVLAAIGMAVPSVLAHALSPQAGTHLSDEVAVVLLITYLLSLMFSLVRQEPEVQLGATHVAEAPEWGPRLAMVVLAGATMVIAFLSEYLVGAIEDAQAAGQLDAWGMSEIFVGVVLVALIGNAAEHSTAVVMAYRNRVDLTLQIAVGSSTQVALLVTPVLVLASHALAPHPMDLNFSLVEVLALGASVVVVHLVAADGESHWMEGVLLIAVYLILALAFYHLPATHPAAAGSGTPAP
jgi:Ca2+:H+ antiporter